MSQRNSTSWRFSTWSTRCLERIDVVVNRVLDYLVKRLPRPVRLFTLPIFVPFLIVFIPVVMVLATIRAASESRAVALTVLTVVVGGALFVWSPWVSDEERCIATAQQLVRVLGRARADGRTTKEREIVLRARDYGVTLPDDCVEAAVRCYTGASSTCWQDQCVELTYHILGPLCTP